MGNNKNTFYGSGITDYYSNAGSFVSLKIFLCKEENGHATTLLIFCAVGCAIPYNSSKFKTTQQNEVKKFP